METTKDFKRRHVVPQGRSLTVNITGFQAAGFYDGQPVDVELLADGSLRVSLANGPRMSEVISQQITHEWRHKLPPSTDRTTGPKMTATQSPTYRYVLAFGKLMEWKLSQNRHKGDRNGWIGDSPMDLYDRVKEETTELLVALANGGTWEEVALEAADVANMAMMVADAYVHQKSEGSHTIVDLEPAEWALAPLHSGMVVYRSTLDRLASTFEVEGAPAWLVAQFREVTAELNAYVQGL